MNPCFQIVTEDREEKGVFSLHSVRKSPSKPCKKPVLPTPPRVYSVDPPNFRQLVQKLTGAPRYRSRRLRRAAPPPLKLAPPPLPVPNASAAPSESGSVTDEFWFELDKTEPAKVSDNFTTNSFGFFSPSSHSMGFLSPSSHSMGFLSPSAYSWCSLSSSFPLLSPGTIASLEQSTVP